MDEKTKQRLMDHYLKTTWDKLMSDLGVDQEFFGHENKGAFKDLVRRYSQPDRHYHNLEHIMKMLLELEDLRVRCNRKAIAFAVFFHDAIYDPKRKDNELQSAELARVSAWSLGLPNVFAEKVFSLIMATEHKKMPESQDEKVIVDLDLASLASEPEVFDANTRKIRQEYSCVSDEDFDRGSLEFMVRMLERPQIFSLPKMREKHEAKARANLLRALKKIRK